MQSSGFCCVPTDIRTTESPSAAFSRVSIDILYVYLYMLQIPGVQHPFLPQKVPQVWSSLILLLDYCDSLQSACMCHSSSAVHPEYGSQTGLQPTQVLPLYTSPPQPSLATGGCLNLIHVTSFLPGVLWRAPDHTWSAILPHRQTIRPSPLATSSLRAEQPPLNNIWIVCWPGSNMGERAPHWPQDSWN
jgi:hypothetical protein